jgi:hypothetical protein
MQLTLLIPLVLHNCVDLIYKMRKPDSKRTYYRMNQEDI